MFIMLFEGAISKTINSVLGRLPVSYSLILAVFLSLAAFGCWLIGASQPSQRVLALRVGAVLLASLLFALTVYMNYALFHNNGSPTARIFGWIGISLAVPAIAFIYTALILKEPRFGPDVMGVLVLQILGDADNSTQEDLLGQLNSRLSDSSDNVPIEVHTAHVAVSEDNGLRSAHQEARAIGRKHNAGLVLWGRKTKGDKFYPRVTVVNPDTLKFTAARTYDVVYVGDVQLPDEVLNAPFYVINFLQGCFALQASDWNKALELFEQAIQHAGDEKDAAGLFSYAGITASILCARDDDFYDNSAKAVGFFEKASAKYRTGDKEKIARAQANLAAAYGQLRSGRQTENLKNAIAAANKALNLISIENSPETWATAEWNLGAAYGDLQSGDRKANLLDAISHFESALTVRTNEKDPLRWALLNMCLGIANRQLNDLDPSDRRNNAERALSYYERAMTIATETGYPLFWAAVRTYMGNAYADLKPPQFIEARACFSDALRVLTRARAPFRWAITQMNLGKLNVMEAREKKDKVLLEKAITAFEECLEIFHEDTNPQYWAQVQRHLAFAYFELGYLAGQDETEKIVLCLQNALRVFTEAGSPADWANVQQVLGQAYLWRQTGNPAQNFHDAIDCLNNAERVSTKDADPLTWAELEMCLGLACKRFILLDPVQNHREAKRHFELALVVYDERNFPAEHKAVEGALEELKHLLLEVPTEQMPP